MFGIFLIIWTHSCTSNAADIEWFEVRDKSILQITCNKKEYKLVLKTVEIDKKQVHITNWFDNIINKCKEF